MAVEFNFQKYSSIENSYNTGFLTKACNYDGTLLNDQLYHLSEKTDGTNFTISLKHGEVKFGRRTDYLTDDEKFYPSWRDVVKESMGELIEWMKEHTMHGENIDTQYDFIGEMFGPGIQSRIKYGDQKTIKLFDLRINGRYLSRAELEKFFEDTPFKQTLLIPTYMMVRGLNNALAIEPAGVVSGYNVPDENNSYNKVEGFVIRPYEREVFMPNGARFILKNKTEEFAEKMNNKAHKGTKQVQSLSDLQTEFLSYLNPNRVISVESKFGKFSDLNDMGKYIKLVLEDAFDDYAKDNEIADEDKPTAKKQFGFASKTIVDLLKAAL